MRIWYEVDDRNGLGGAGRVIQERGGATIWPTARILREMMGTDGQVPGTGATLTQAEARSGAPKSIQAGLRLPMMPP